MEGESSGRPFQDVKRVALGFPYIRGFPNGSLVTVTGIMLQSISTARSTRSLWIGCMAMTLAIFVCSWSQGAPSSQVDTTAWVRREIAEFGISFKLPEKYREKSWAVTVGSPIAARRFVAGPAFVDFELIERTTFEKAKTGFQLSFEDYREWTDQIRGHKLLIQTFTGGGSIITEKGVFPPHQVSVLCELDAKRQRFLRIDTACATKEEREEILAIVGTLEFL